MALTPSWKHKGPTSSAPKGDSSEGDGCLHSMLIRVLKECNNSWCNPQLAHPKCCFYLNLWEQYGCGSNLSRRGKPQVLVHVSTSQGNPCWISGFFGLPLPISPRLRVEVAHSGSLSVAPARGPGDPEPTTASSKEDLSRVVSGVKSVHRRVARKKNVARTKTWVKAVYPRPRESNSRRSTPISGWDSP